MRLHHKLKSQGYIKQKTRFIITILLFKNIKCSPNNKNYNSRMTTEFIIRVSIVLKAKCLPEGEELSRNGLRRLLTVVF